MKRQPIPRAYESRRGVALIVVLGFLSLMVMMAVAFLTQARMERQVAGSTLEAMRGRQLLRTAINAAMNNYSVVLSDRPDPIVMPSEANGFDVVASTAAGGGSLAADNIELLVGEVEDWIPWRYRTVAVTNLVEGANWILVKDTTASPNRILGRYAYVCFDMSGGIDANLVALENLPSASNRVRRSVRQMPMGMLPEALNSSEFKNLRRGWKGFDSLQAVMRLADGYPEDGTQSKPSPANNRWRAGDGWSRKEQWPAISNVNDLVPFSLSAFRGGRYDQGSGLWTPYVLCGESTDWPAVLAPIGSQFGGSVPAWIQNAIYDFTHSNAAPRGLDYPSPKNVPMFNELAGFCRLFETPAAGGPGSSTYELSLDLQFEFWYPFPSADNATPAEGFSLPAPTLAAGPRAQPTHNLWFTIMPIPRGAGQPPLLLEFGAFAQPAPTAVPLPAANKWRPYTTGVSRITYTIPLVERGTGSNQLPPGLTIPIQAVGVATAIVLRTESGVGADMMPSGLSFPGANLSMSARDLRFAAATTDPRFNHDPGQWGVENGGSGSLNQMNTWFANDAALRDQYLQEGTNLYCRNKALETPADLGFISVGQPWKTIDLCTDAGAGLMATLVTDTNLWTNATGAANAPWTGTSVFYTNGTINPNTSGSNVLASAFYLMPVHEAPNSPAREITTNEAGFIAARILEETESGAISGVFHSGTDWIRIPAMREGGPLFTTYGLNNNQRESLLRDTWGLFNVDNSLFTVVAVAQAIKEGPNNVGIWDANEDLITGERRAVALVWRDPFRTGQNLHHEMFIRMFRYLND